MEFWNNIYNQFDPVAFQLGSISVHWYGIMYAAAFLSAIFAAKWIVRKDNIPITQDQLDSYIWWVEIGVILGARVGYIIFYDPNTLYYLTQPWQIFNPFDSVGNFAGISGMSYHGAVIGFIVASYLWSKRYKISFWMMSDIAAIAVPLGYTFGRIGNFLNQELVGRETELSWGIYVNGVLRHPSAIYEAVLEGVFIFLIIYFTRQYKKFDGQLGMLYVLLYSIMRSIAEIFREPDPQLGFLFDTNWLTMGMLISSIFSIMVLFVYIYLYKRKI
ncbi:MAG: prolipoprotein diacylglyceryl transferase [Campylobacterota bacterium]|nr:prolipoprotein diacylglyceryl transferase [Campylobacterota bacterium]